MSVDPFRFVGGSFDDLINRSFGAEPFAARPAERVDLSQLLSEDSWQLLQRAAEQAAQWGSPYINVEHLLWAATQADPTRRMIDAAGADPDDLARQMEAAVPKGEPTDEAPPLAPAAKRALLEAHHESQLAGTTYIGPDHILLGIAANPETTAGKALRTLARGVTVDPAPRGQGEPRRGRGRAQRE